MTLVKGPNGHVWDLDPVVASGLLGSASGDYSAPEAEPEPDEKSRPVKRSPRKKSN